MKTALITGATGFTGSHVVPLLIDRGWRVRCFARPSSNKRVLPANAVEWVSGDLDETATLLDALQSVDILVNMASLGFGHAPDIIRAARAAGVKRALFISTTALFTSLNPPGKKVRLAAEEAIFKSGLDYTIIRPTMIYGTSRDRNMCRLICYLKTWPVIPVFGKGENLQQPVYVKDLAKAIVDALSTKETIGNAYTICGAEAMSYNDVIDTVCRCMKRHVLKVHVPYKPSAAMLTMMEKWGLPFPIKAEQVLRLNEDKAFRFEAARHDFNFNPRSFAEGIELELKEMGMDGLPS